MCSGSWDCTINLWQTKASEAGGDLVSVKKRKTGGENEESQSEVLRSCVFFNSCVQQSANMISL